LGLASYYQKFIEGFGKIAAPLNQLLKKEIEYQWNEDCQQAFEELKQRLTTAPILGHPDFSKPFIVMTDASKNGLGAILTQKDEFNREVVIRYASRATTSTERNYAATQLE